MRFVLYHAESGGDQQGLAALKTSVSISNWLFGATRDFGSGTLNGSARWLEIAVRASGSGSFTALHPRQAITAALMAFSALTPAGLPARRARAVRLVRRVLKGRKDHKGWPDLKAQAVPKAPRV